MFDSDGSVLLAYYKVSVVQHLGDGATGSDPSDDQAMEIPLQLAGIAVEHAHVDPTDESSSH